MFFAISRNLHHVGWTGAKISINWKMKAYMMVIRVYEHTENFEHSNNFMRLCSNVKTEYQPVYLPTKQLMFAFLSYIA